MNHHQTPQNEKKAIRSNHILISVLAFGFYGLTASISPAHAGALSNALCLILNNIVLSNIGRGAATLAVMSVGVAAALGKASMGMAITVAVGISLLYGATTIAYDILPNVTGPICPISR